MKNSFTRMNIQHSFDFEILQSPSEKLQEV